jgi:hypothetical protein
MYSVPAAYDKSYCPLDGCPKIYNKLQKFESKGLVSIPDDADKKSVFLISFFLGGGGVVVWGINLISIL